MCGRRSRIWNNGGVIALRVLCPDDWKLWRELRLAALSEAPDVYQSALQQWAGPADTEQRWRRRLAEVPFNAVLALNGRSVGMVSATEPGAGDEAGGVELISLWVAPEARGRGVGDVAVRAGVRWVTVRYPGCPVSLSVKAHNQWAIGLFLRNGFVYAGPVDGEHELRMVRRPAGGPGSDG